MWGGDFVMQGEWQLSRVQRLLAAVDVERRYDLDSEEVHALRGVNLNVFPGQFIAVVGRSGSGRRRC